jgi:hypothetical protein
VGLLRGKDRKRAREKRIAREESYCLTIDFVNSGASSAQIVIIHAWKIVVDEGKSMHHFYGARRWHRHGRIGTARIGCHQCEQWTQSLAWAEQSIVHRFADRISRIEKGLFQCRIDCRPEFAGECIEGCTRRSHTSIV